MKSGPTPRILTREVKICMSNVGLSYGSKIFGPNNEGLSHGSKIFLSHGPSFFSTMSHGSNPPKTGLWALAQTDQLLNFEPWLKPPQKWTFEPWLKPTFDMQIFTWNKEKYFVLTFSSRQIAHNHNSVRTNIYFGPNWISNIICLRQIVWNK